MWPFNLFFKKEKKLPILLYSILEDDHTKVFKKLSDLKEVCSLCFPKETAEEHGLRISIALREILKEWEEHIVREEELMKVFQYPDVLVHRSSHQRIARLLALYYSECRGDNCHTDENIYKEVKAIIVYHLENEDARLETFLTDLYTKGNIKIGP